MEATFASATATLEQALAVLDELAQRSKAIRAAIKAEQGQLSEAGSTEYHDEALTNPADIASPTAPTSKGPERPPVFRRRGRKQPEAGASRTTAPAEVVGTTRGEAGAIQVEGPPEP